MTPIAQIIPATAPSAHGQPVVPEGSILANGAGHDVGGFELLFAMTLSLGAALDQQPASGKAVSERMQGQTGETKPPLQETHSFLSPALLNQLVELGAEGKTAAQLLGIKPAETITSLADGDLLADTKTLTAELVDDLIKVNPDGSIELVENGPESLPTVETTETSHPSTQVDVSVEAQVGAPASVIAQALQGAQNVNPVVKETPLNPATTGNPAAGPSGKPIDSPSAANAQPNKVLAASTASANPAAIAQAASQGAKPHVWTVQELSHQLRATLQQLQAPAENSTPSPAPAKADTTVWMNAAANAAAPKTSLDGLNQILHRAAFARSMASSDMPLQPNANAFHTQLGSMGTPVLEWAAQPVTDPQGTTRMPSMIEQMQTVAEMLANRTEGVIRMGERGVEANLRLYPPDLGGVRVQLNVSQGGVIQAQFVAEHAETARLIEQHTQHLREVLGRHGLVMDQVHVTVQTAQGGQSATNQFGPNHFQQNGSGANYLNGERRENAEKQWNEATGNQQDQGQNPDEQEGRYA